jgi:hypothetical protein
MRKHEQQGDRLRVDVYRPAKGLSQQYFPQPRKGDLQFKVVPD